MTPSPQRPILALYEALEAQTVKAGTVVPGTVTQVDDEYAFVQLEGISGHAPLSGFPAPPTIGETLDLYVEQVEGEVVTLSRDKAVRLGLHDRLEKASAEGETLPGTVLRSARGGFAVSVLGVKAYMPASQVDPSRGALAEQIGQGIPVRVRRMVGFKGRVELVDAAIPDVSPEQAREQVLAELEPGAIVQGQVKRLAKFGAFVDLGGVDGLIANPELGWGRVRHPADVVEPGQMVSVKVLGVDAERGRVSLSLKATQPDPWGEAVAQYTPGTRLEGPVTGVTEYGAFVAVAPGVEGLVHISEMQWGGSPKTAGELVRKGQTVAVEVIEADTERRRLRLSMKRLADNPWQSLAARYPQGTRLLGPVRNVTDFGVFVGVEEGVDGLVHVSDIEWGQVIRAPKDRFAVGDEIEVMVLQVDVERQRLSLGIKQLTADNRDALFDAISVGQTVEGRVANVVDFGAFVVLPGGVEGLVHKSDMGGETPHSAKDVLRSGQTVQVTVLSIDADAGRIGLSLAGPPEELTPARVEAPEAPAEAAAEAAPEAPAEAAAEVAEAPADAAPEAPEPAAAVEAAPEAPEPEAAADSPAEVPAAKAPEAPEAP